jgi:hypothetical protein
MSDHAREIELTTSHRSRINKEVSRVLHVAKTFETLGRNIRKIEFTKSSQRSPAGRD